VLLEPALNRLFPQPARATACVAAASRYNSSWTGISAKAPLFYCPYKVVASGEIFLQIIFSIHQELAAGTKERATTVFVNRSLGKS
jgi:hypothetical protein